MSHKIQNKTNKKLQNELETYLDFVAIYKRNRSPEAKRLVEHIINEESSIVVRIKRIEEIDKQYSGKIETRQDSERTEESEQPGEKSKAPAIQPLIKCPFFRFLVFERSRLINFGNRTQTIDFKFLGLKKELSAKAIVFWRQIYAEVRDNLYKQINFVLLNGWKDLDQKSYNTVAQFNKFMVKFIKEGEMLDRSSASQQNLKVVESFIEPYLKLTVDPSYRDILKEAIVEILGAKPEYKQNLKEIVRILDEVTNTDKRTLCFFNIILAIYSIHYNNFVKHFDLVNSFNVVRIQTEHHEFETKTLNEIREYLIKINEELEVVEEELFFLKFIDGDLNFKSSTDKKLVVLFNKYFLYEQYSKREALDPDTANMIYEQNSFQLLFQEVVKNLAIAAAGFLAYYVSILVAKIDVYTQGQFKTVGIFMDSYLGKEIHEIEVAVKDYNYYKQSGAEVISVPYETFHKFSRLGKVEIEKEEKLCRMADGIVKSLKEIAYKIINVLYQHERAGQCSGDELLAKYKSQNEIVDDYYGESRFIPYAFEEIKHHRYLDGDHVIDVLSDIAHFAINLVFLFQDEEVVDRYLQHGSHVEKMERILKIKAKVE